MKLMLEDRVFLLFGYVGTPTVTRVLPILKKFQDEQVYLFFPFTGAQPQREPPYGDFAFNLRASYRQETAGPRRQLRWRRQEADRRVLPGRCLWPQRLGRSPGGPEGARRANCRRGDLPPRTKVHRKHEAAGGNTAGRFPGSGDLYRFVCCLRRLRSRRRGPGPPGSDSQPLLRGEREPPSASQRGPG